MQPWFHHGLPGAPPQTCFASQASASRGSVKNCAFTPSFAYFATSCSIATLARTFSARTMAQYFQPALAACRRPVRLGPVEVLLGQHPLTAVVGEPLAGHVLPQQIAAGGQQIAEILAGDELADLVVDDARVLMVVERHVRRL